MSLLSDEPLSLISSAYEVASKSNTDMTSSTLSLEAIRSALTNDDIFELFNVLDDQIGLAGVTPFRTVLLDLRVKLTNYIERTLVDDLLSKFRRNPNNAWKYWLNLLGKALTFSRYNICTVLLYKQLPFPDFAKPAIEEVENSIEGIRYNWADGYELYNFLANQESMSNLNKSQLLVTASIVDLFVYYRPEVAKKTLDLANNIYPDNSRVHCGFGEYYLYLQDYDNAIKSFQNAIDIDSKSSWAHSGLGSCYELLNKFLSAEEYYEESISKAPGYVWAYVRMCRFYGRVEIFKIHEETILDYSLLMDILDPEFKYQVRLMLGDIYMENNRLESASQWFTKAIGENSKLPYAYTSLGYLYFQLGEHDKVLEAFEKAINLSPKYFEGYWALAWFYEAKMEWSKALSWYQKCSIYRPQWNSKLLTKIGEMKWKMGSLAEGLEDCLSALKEEPNDTFIMDLLNNMAIESFTNMNNYQRAAHIYKSIYDIKGDDYSIEYHNRLASMYSYLKDWEQANYEANEAFKIHKDETQYQNSIADILILQGNEYFVKGATERANSKYKEALAIYEKLLTRTDLTEIKISKGNVLYNLGEYEKALQAYDEAIKSGAEDATLFINRANCLYIIGRNAEAIVSFDKVLELEPDNSDALTGKGIAQVEMGQLEKAIESYDRVLKFDPLNDLALQRKGDALYDLGRFDYAINDYDKVLETDPDNIETITQKANALSSLKKYDEALKLYMRALDIDKTYLYALLNLGQLMGTLSRHQEAIQYYDKALESDPKNFTAWFNIGVEYSVFGKLQAALEAFDKALEIDPRDVPSLVNKGDCLSRLGDPKKALQIYDQALQIAPNDDMTLNNKAWQLAAQASNDEALNIVNKALDINPNNDYALDTKALILYNLGKYEESLQFSNKSLAILENTVRLRHKADSLMKLGRIEEAQECLDRSNKLEQSSA